MSLDDQPINWGEFYKAYTGIRFTINRGECQVFVPKYANVSHASEDRDSKYPHVPSIDTCSTSGSENIPTTTPSMSGTFMSFRDEWSSNAFLVAGDSTRLNEVFLKELWEYPENNVKWDEFNELLSFQDIETEETNLLDFVEDLDSFLAYQKLEKFGNVWWVGRVKTNLEGDEESSSLNVTVTNASDGATATNTINFWSPDKHINDEYKRYVSNPSTYTGFLTSDDFKSGGWFNVPDLTISTKPFEKLKIADAILNLNFTYDPEPFFGHSYAVDSTIGARIKDNTANVVLDASQGKMSQNDGEYADTIISHWAGGLTDSDNLPSDGEVGSFQDDPCDLKTKEITNVSVENNPNAVSHKIDAQITVKPDYSNTQIDFLGTIDPISWKSVDTPPTENPHNIGNLNQDRAFGGASGNIDGGIVAGGIITDADGATKVTSASEVWQNDTFVRNLVIDLNNPRCMHIQGGNGSSSCAVVGGFSSMENNDVGQFGQYGKTSVRSDMEYFVQSEGTDLSFFKKIGDYTMNVARGEGGGTLDVTTNVRQDKFEVEDLIKGYNITPDDEQAILEFVNDSSTDLVGEFPVPSNFRRYNVSNIEGFVYAGNKTGKVYLLDSPTENDIIDHFESINTTYVDISQNIISQAIEESVQSIDDILNTIIVDTNVSTIEPMVTVDASNSGTVDVSLDDCGKYRLEYINGAYEFKNPDYNTSEHDLVSVDFNSTDGVSRTLEKCGKYRVEYLNGEYTFKKPPADTVEHDLVSVDYNSSAGESITLNNCGTYRIDYLNGDYFYSKPASDTVEHEIISVDSTLSGGVTRTLENCGTYRIDYIDGTWDNENIGASNPSNVLVSGTNSVGVPYGLHTCGLWRVSYSSGQGAVLFDSDVDDDYYKVAIQYSVNGGPWTTGINGPVETTSQDAQDGAHGENFTFCNDVVNGSVRLRFIDSSYGNNVGSINVTIQFIGYNNSCGGCGFTDTIFELNNNRTAILFDGNTDSYEFCNEVAGSEITLTANSTNFNDNEGAVNVRVTYVDHDSCQTCVDNISGAPEDTKRMAVEVNNNPEFVLFDGNSDSYEFCNELAGSKLTFIPVPERNLNDGAVNVRVTYIDYDSCSTCVDDISGGDDHRTRMTLDLNNNFETVLFDNNTDPYEFCNEVAGSEINLIPNTNRSNNDGAVNVRIIYVDSNSCPTCVENISAGYRSNTGIHLNGQDIGSAFGIPVQDTIAEVELYNDARPSRQIFDFCVTERKSTISLFAMAQEDLDSKYYDGSTNLRILYLGQDDGCSCSISESTDLAPSIEKLEVSINHSTTEPSKNYPVRCHGLTYVGGINGGISTGGRTEYNDIDVVECRLREKYGLIPKNLCMENSLSDNPLEANRVLDLVYEYDGDTWIRKQNLFESVYYHTGVGDRDSAIFWGGIHDTISEYSYNLEVSSVDVETIPASSFDCPDSKNFDIQDIARFGVDYDSVEEIENGTCWEEPSWLSPSLSGALKVDDPRYRNTNTSLSNALDDDFPDIYVVSVSPSNPTSVTEQPTSTPVFNVDSVSRLEIDVSHNDGEAEYETLSYILNDDNTLNTLDPILGTMQISEVKDLIISSSEYNLYPSSGYVGDSFGFEMTDVKVLSSGEVVYFYSLRHLGPGFELTGYGRIVFPSLQSIWLSIDAGDGEANVTALSHVFKVQKSTEIESVGGPVGLDIEGSASLTFKVGVIDAVLVGVENRDEVWNAQSSQCGPDLSEFISLTAELGQDNGQRWGTPLWVDGFYNKIPGLLTIEYGLDLSSEDIETGIGESNYESTTISISADSLATLLNDRVLLTGETHSQEHLFTAIGPDIDFDDLTPIPDCENVSGAFGSTVSDGGSNGEGYSEWASSFVQEYQSDERYSTPERYIPSNSAGIKVSNKFLPYEPSTWKRLMDGVGLGGDVPDYSSIVDLDGKEKNVSSWSQIGSWFIGQMSFGTTQRAVICGGHRVDPTKKSVGLHAFETSKRVFVWDFADIPPEDSYLTNYLGRRTWTYYVDDNGIMVPTDSQSTFATTIYDAESTINVERQGSAKFDGSVGEVEVEFEEDLSEEVGINYSISLMPSDNIKVWWSDKKTSGFTIKCEATGWTGSVDYVISAEVKTTTEDFESLGPLDGYIIDK